jgi:hypothetical protein
MFEASVGTSFTSDIALDDVQISNGACADPGNCDFEKGECTWINAQTDDINDNFDWIRATQVPSLQTGPSTDHSLGTNKGHFMYIESSWPRQWGEKARLESEVLPPTSGQCMQFWFNMNGAHVNKLSILLKVVEQSESRVWTYGGDRGDKWRQGQIPIKSAKPFVVGFTHFFSGVVALLSLLLNKSFVRIRLVCIRQFILLIFIPKQQKFYSPPKRDNEVQRFLQKDLCRIREGILQRKWQFQSCDALASTVIQ